MSTLKELGRAARDITSITRAAKNVGKFLDDAKQKAGDGLGTPPAVRDVQQEFRSFRVRVVVGLLGKGWTHEEIADLTGLSPLVVAKLEKLGHKLGPEVVDDEDDTEVF